MSRQTPALIVLAAGGSGGHIFPAEALARALTQRGLRVALITDKRGSRFSDDLAVPVYRIHVHQWGGDLIGKLKGLALMGIGYVQARLILHRLRPAAVVGFGGYPSVPTVFAAAAAGIPVVLHEQNAALGRANRVLLTQARLLATGFPQVRGLLHGAKTPRIIHTGNPVRPAFAVLRDQSYRPPTEDGPIQLLVMGGSQGARVFSDVVPQALARLPEPLRRRLVIAQQCRAEDMERARANFAAAGIDAELAPFFRDVPERMARCHLAICRAGAATMAELTSVGRPTILVPYPFSATQDQAANAEALAEAGGAWVIPQDSFTPDALAARLEALLTMPATLEKTAVAARNWSTPAAADNLAACISSLIPAAQ